MSDDRLSEKAFASNVAWFARALQLNDSFYPTGAYAHSFGLEGLVEQGVVRDRETLREYVFASLIPALARNEMPLACHASRGFAEQNWDLVGEVSLLSAAIKSSREARVASENIGRQRAELCASLHKSELAREYLERSQREGWPYSSAVSCALEGHVIGMPRDAILASMFYSAVSTLLAAAMKLLRIGQNGSQSLLTEAMSHATKTISAAQNVALTEIGWFNPWLDIAAARHERAEARLFIS
ncbi:MAG TPA: urease accessory UreF family protein [Opitutaceae bacterium]|nr:urease accessory UreF family protein [Opitutaceae bacterium]